jgi:hypothetical protein
VLTPTVRCCLLDAVYAGVHTDACAGIVIPNSMHEHCEACRWRFYASGRSDPLIDNGNPGNRSATVLKPVGQRCLKCGDNSPAGSFPWNGPVWCRIGENEKYQYVGQYGEVSRERLFASLHQEAA